MTNPTLLVASFDNSLALTDVNGAGTWTGVDPIRYAEVGAADGLRIEEATTNLVKNPVVRNNNTGWTQWGGNAPVRTDTTATIGEWSLRQTRPSTAATWHGILTHPDSRYAVTEAVVYAASIDLVSSVAITNVVFGIRWLNSGNSLISSSLISNQSVGTDPANPTRLAVAAAAPVNAVTAELIAYTTGGTVSDTLDYTRMQFEENSYATSFTAGHLGDGYAWSGTAHASTSTRAASSASVDPTDRIDASAGAIAFRYKRLIDTGGEEVILTCGTVGSGTDYLEIGIDANDDLYMEWNSNNGGAQRVTSTAANIAVDTEYLFYFDWDGTTIRVSVDNGALDSDTRDAVEGDWGAGDLELVA